MKIINIVGARPQFIKLAPFCAELRRHSDVENIVINSGQHYDYSMSKLFFDELDIPIPKYNLEVGSGSHLYQMGNILLKLDKIFDDEKPDIVVVYGDTNTTSAAAIAAAKKNIPLAHVEAGLREHDKKIPEEVNKLLTDSVADLYFSPTQTGLDNLAKAGVSKNAFLVGDIGVDLLVQFSNKVEAIEEKEMSKYEIKKDNYCFMTCHRAANTDNVNNLKNILAVLPKLDCKIVFPMHPRTKSAIKNNGLEELLHHDNICVIEPIGFWETQALIKNSKFCLTDSGGVIKEAYFHKVPGIIIDTQTEWVETLNEGWNQLVGPYKSEILNAIEKAKTKPTIHSNCLGNGTASEQIFKCIINFLHGN